MKCLPRDVYKIIYKMLYDNVMQDIINVITIKDDHDFDILRANGGVWERYYIDYNARFDNMLLWYDVWFDFNNSSIRLSVIDGRVYFIKNSIYHTNMYIREKASFIEVSTWKYIQDKLKYYVESR